jgi:hydroxymethylglutaryl-CoA reductase (NADPH)
MEGPMLTSTQDTSGRTRVPRDPCDESTDAAAQARRQFLRQRTGADLHHETFTGVAQVPIGVAGPLRIHGEHARGDFSVPLATTEGILVASDNRGMRLSTEGGGVRAAVVDEHTQRSPVFVLDHVLRAWEFGRWVASHDRLGRNR